MNFKTFCISTIFCLLSFYSISAQTVTTVSKNDFKDLIGSWQGALTYLDYTSNEPYTMPADIEIRQIGKTNKFIFANSYPNEPNANSSDTVTISTDGRRINDDTIKSKRNSDDGNLEIVTEVFGVDGNESKPAVIRQTYIVSPYKFIIRKDVQFAGHTEWLKRHEYNYKKVKTDR